MFVLNRATYHAHEVFERYPTDVLAAAPDLPAYAELERREHLRQSAAFAAQDEAYAQVHDAHARLTRRERCLLPLSADLAQEALARSALFAQDFVAAVAVEADGRSGDEHARLLLETRKRLRNQARALHSALYDSTLLRVVPAPFGNRLAREAHCR